MSGPKSSSYQVDPRVLRERMLEAEHQRNMTNIRNEACRKADLLLSKMRSETSSVNMVYANESSLSSIRTMLEKIGRAESDGLYNDRLASVRNELMQFSAELSEADIQRIKLLESELEDLLSERAGSEVGRVVSEHSEFSQNNISKAALFDEEQHKKCFRIAAEELFTEAALSGIEETVPEFDSKNFEVQIEQMRQRKEELQKIREKNTANEYIYSTAIQVINEMGYRLLGEKRTCGNINFRSSLFRIDDKTAFSITQSSDGSVVYEVVGVSSTGELSPEIIDAVEHAMQTMCEDEFDRFLRLLASKGITPEGILRRLPPHRQFAAVKKLSEYTDSDTNADMSANDEYCGAHHSTVVNRKTNRKVHVNGTN